MPQSETNEKLSMLDQSGTRRIGSSAHQDQVQCRIALSTTGLVADSSPSTRLALDVKCKLFVSAEDKPSRWTRSGWKRFFDLTLVFVSLPLFVPLIFIVAVAVRLTSRGPILFRQSRVGQDGRAFQIFKFRTMTHLDDGEHAKVTSNSSMHFTAIGLFLRKWKLDELPQLFNVLRGEMSLVGPRPKVPEHQLGILRTRPGITGAATIAFAREGKTLTRIPERDLQSYYRSVILPIKLKLDAEYGSRATLVSDLKILLRSLARCWYRTALNLHLLQADYPVSHVIANERKPLRQPATQTVPAKPSIP